MYSRFSGIIIVGQHNPCTSSLTTQQNTSYYVLKKQRTTRAHPSLYAFLFLSATYSFELHPCTYIYSITPDPRCSCKINLLYRRQYTPPIRSTSSRTFITRALVLLLREAHNTYKAAQRYHVASELSFHWAQLTLNIAQTGTDGLKVGWREAWTVKDRIQYITYVCVHWMRAYIYIYSSNYSSEGILWMSTGGLG